MVSCFFFLFVVASRFAMVPGDMGEQIQANLRGHIKEKININVPLGKSPFLATS